MISPVPLADHAGSIKLHLVPFTEIQTAFTQLGQDNLIITLMRRSMLRIATKLAERERALALITGIVWVRWQAKLFRV